MADSRHSNVEEVYSEEENPEPSAVKATDHHHHHHHHHHQNAGNYAEPHYQDDDLYEIDGEDDEQEVGDNRGYHQKKHNNNVHDKYYASGFTKEDPYQSDFEQSGIMLPSPQVNGHSHDIITEDKLQSCKKEFEEQRAKIAKVQ